MKRHKEVLKPEIRLKNDEKSIQREVEFLKLNPGDDRSTMVKTENPGREGIVLQKVE